MLYFILSRCITNFGIQFLPELFLSKSFNSLYKNILFIDKSHVLQNNFAQDEVFSFSLIATKILEYSH